MNTILMQVNLFHQWNLSIPNNLAENIGRSKYLQNKLRENLKLSMTDTANIIFYLLEFPSANHLT